MNKLQPKYIKAFSQEKSDELSSVGCEFLYQQNGVYYHRKPKQFEEKFSNSDLFKDTKFSMSINF